MKQPLLLLHGAISSAKQFDILLPFLNREFEVYAPDFPGHGGRAIPETFSMPLFAESVLEYFDNKKLNRASVFGYSMGGYVALYLAAHYPERVNKVFTLATKFDWTENTAEKEAAQLNPEKVLEKVPAFAAELQKIHSPQDWKKVFAKTAAMLLDLGKNPVLTEKVFGQIKIPVIISIGDSDKMVSIDESKSAAEHISNGQLLQLPATQHPFEKVNHQMLAGHMNDFLWAKVDRLKRN